MAALRTQTIVKEVKYNCRPEDLYNALTDSRMVSTYTQSPATGDVKIGGRATYFGGSLQADYVELVPFEKIVQKWWFQDWADGVQSTVTYSFTSPSYGVCVLKLTHEGIPEADKFGNSSVPEKVDQGWTHKFFNPISKFLGFSFYIEDDD